MIDEETRELIDNLSSRIQDLEMRLGVSNMEEESAPTERMFPFRTSDNFIPGVSGGIAGDFTGVVEAVIDVVYDEYLHQLLQTKRKFWFEEGVLMKTSRPATDVPPPPQEEQDITEVVFEAVPELL